MASIPKVLEIDAELNVSEVVIDCNLEIGTGGRLPYYEGEYEVTPKAYDPVVLATKNKSMANDVKVFKIPTEKVSNASGYTFAIAREGVTIDG